MVSSLYSSITLQGCYHFLTTAKALGLLLCPLSEHFDHVSTDDLFCLCYFIAIVFLLNCEFLQNKNRSLFILFIAFHMIWHLVNIQ